MILVIFKSNLRFRRLPSQWIRSHCLIDISWSFFNVSNWFGRERYVHYNSSNFLEFTESIFKLSEAITDPISVTHPEDKNQDIFQTFVHNRKVTKSIVFQVSSNLVSWDKTELLISAMYLFLLWSSRFINFIQLFSQWKMPDLITFFTSGFPRGPNKLIRNRPVIESLNMPVLGYKVLLIRRYPNNTTLAEWSRISV